MRTIYPFETNRLSPLPPLVLFLFLALSSCQKKADTPADLTQEIKSTLMLFSSSLAQADTMSLSKICSSNFVLLDEGKFYNKPRLYNSITSILSTGSMTREPYDMHVETHGDFAWTYYKVRGEFKSAGASFNLNLIESALLRRFENKWMIVQASTMPSAPN